MAKHFTNLHVHTDYSLLDGAISLDKLIAFGKEQQFKALSITDHGNIFGAVKFFQKCKKSGIKPILGIEAYFTEDATVKQADNKYYHLILLVQNRQGYENLCKLISYSYQKGFYFKPRIDYRILEKHCDGLIATTACLGGLVPQLLKNGKLVEAQQQIDHFVSMFGKDRFYLEVQPEDQQEQAVLNKQLYTIAQEANLELIATSDAHYCTPDDHYAHEVMLAVQTHDTVDNPKRYTFGDCRVHLRTQDEMLSLFAEHESAVWNTGVIADACEFDFETDKLFFPKVEIPQSHTQDSYFEYQCKQGLEQLFSKGLIAQDQRAIYEARLQEEVDLIVKMGFPGYFLVVSDFIQWARRNGIPVGPGRGSAAGSLASWCLEITNIDPLKYNLLFERFLNPERVSMPDIDIDFCIEGRDTVINYVRDKYGHDKVCHIITFGTMMAKGVIKDVARALGFSFEDSNAITNLIPDQLKITLAQAIEQEPRLKELIENNQKTKKLFDIAFKLEGLTRHASKHAAGIVISPRPIDEVLPVYVPPKSTELVAQYAMTELESIGFLKIDFLGLKNLTLIDRAVQAITTNHGITLDMDKLPLDDSKAFELICQGKTSGVFQLESDGLKEVLRKLQPQKFEDIIAVNALYRPGPLGSGMVDDFIERRHGRQKITYLLPELEPILKETYGVIVYQEQVMKIASAIAGYSLGESDILRRAMGKKKVEVMAEQRELFLQRSKERGFDEKRAGELFDLMAYFAGYGFNKSHSAAYAMIAYQTAYLKANYPAEFMACLISLEASNAEKMAFYLQEAKEMGLPLLPPDINSSQIQFTVHNDGILFGLQGIKNIGTAALENIIAERAKKPFLDLYDLCKRVDLRTTNKRVLENLIAAGACDQLPGHRAQQYNEVAHIIEKAVAYKKDAATGQMGLFSGSAKKNGPDLYDFAPCAAWNDKEKLEREKQVIGFYLSAHPLESYQPQLKRLKLLSFTESVKKAEATAGQQNFVTIACGLLRSRKDIVTKKGDRMSFIQLESMDEVAEVILFPKTFAQVEEWLDTHHVFIVKGEVDITATQCKIKARDFVPIEQFFEAWPTIQAATITLPHAFDDALLDMVKKSIVRGNVHLTVQFTEQGTPLQVVCKEKIQITQELVEKMEQMDISVMLTL